MQDFNAISNRPLKSSLSLTVLLNPSLLAGYEQTLYRTLNGD